MERKRGKKPINFTEKGSGNWECDGLLMKGIFSQKAQMRQPQRSDMTAGYFILPQILVVKLKLAS